jgi:DNA polymerase-3 subunit alpha
VARAAELEMPAFAITDHGNLSAHRETYAACQKHGVKPILGVEAYFTKDRFDRTPRKDRGPDDKAYNHIILLAKDDEGLRNLGRISEAAWKEGYYYKPRMDYDVLEENASGIIVVSGCMNGVISQAILRGDIDEAKSQIEWFQSTFGEDFYIELQPHNPKDLNVTSLELARQYGVKPVLTLDCHYASPEQRVAEEIMLGIGTHPKQVAETNYSTASAISDVMERLDYLYGDRQMSFKELDLYLMGRAEAMAAMSDQGIFDEDIFENTLEVADKVGNYDIPKNLSLLPTISASPDDELRSLAEAGLAERGKAHDSEYVDRLNEELEIIKQKSFAPYFVIVADMIREAKSRGILVGPGRGSAAGSLVVYCLGITDVDPIEHGLLFFRFIDLDREDWPDVDTDIEDSRRIEIKEYMAEKYQHTAAIATYNEFKDKNAIKDVARIFCVPFADVNNALKAVDKWEDIGKSPASKRFATDYPDVIKYADSLRGRVRATGVHPAGIVVSNRPINEVAPIEYRKDAQSGESVPVIALNMEQAAEVGLIKIDLLGLKTLSVISDTLKLVNGRHSKSIELKNIPTNDLAVYQDLSEGKTKGIFQAEQPAYTSLLMKMGVANISELAASNALVRPGAMNSIGSEYLGRKSGRKPISFVHPDTVSYTSETYGLHVYQEQVMLTCIEIGGMSKAEANKVRKIIGKKKDVKEFDQYKEKFIEGAEPKIGREQAEKLWHEFEAHADYSFNKSHAVAYSMLTYWTAWLKHYYPHEFMMALLKNEKDRDSRMEYLIEAKRIGIDIALPHINYSENDFTLEGNKIRFGLNSIKYISDKVAYNIILGRPYTSYKQFYDRASAKFSGINARAIASLNAIGAASFADNPKTGDERSNLYEVLGLPEFSAEIPDWAMERFDKIEDFNEKGSFIFFGVVKAIKRGKGWARVELVDKTGSVGIFDKESTAIQPGSVYAVAVANNSIIAFCPPSSVVSKLHPIGNVIMASKALCPANQRYVIGFRERKTKAGGMMATVMMADDVGDINSALVFNHNFEDVMRKIKPGARIAPAMSMTKDGALTIKEITYGNA